MNEPRNHGSHQSQHPCEGVSQRNKNVELKGRYNGRKWHLEHEQE